MQVYSHKHLHPLPPAEKRIQLFSPAAIRDLFSPAKNITFPYIMTHAYTHRTNTISFILRTSLLDTYHALHTANLYLSGRIQSNSHKIQAMKPLPQLNNGRPKLLNVNKDDSPVEYGRSKFLKFNRDDSPVE